MIIAPSILSADFGHLQDEVEELNRSSAEWIHVDVMDGVFVPSISFGMPILEALKRKTTLLLDVHLMIVEPERYIETVASMGADLITFHLEATKDPLAVIEKIRSLGKKVGLTIKPATPISALEPYLNLVDMVLIMTVEPGFGGQSLMPDCVEKVRDLRKHVRELGMELDIEVDGGVKASNLEMILQAGANVIVAGSAIFGGNPEERTRLFVEKMQMED